MKEPPAVGGGFEGKGFDLKGLSQNATIKGFYSRLWYFAFASPAISGDHGVRSTSGGDLHQLIVKGLSNTPFPSILYHPKFKKQAFFESAQNKFQQCTEGLGVFDGLFLSWFSFNP